MQKARVLCLGEILYDKIADQKGRSLSGVTSWTDYPGGAPANVACALVKLGTPAAFIGCIGEDEPGRELARLLVQIGVEMSGLQQHPSAPTRQVYVTRAENGDREFAGFGDRAPEEFADGFLQGDRLPVTLFEGADFLVLGTLELAYRESRAAIFRALELAREHRLRVVLDVNWRPMFWPDPDAALPLIQILLESVHLLKLAREEALWLFSTADAGAIASRFSGIEGVLVTDGGEAVSYWLHGHSGQVAAFELEVQDTTGAGDGFLAGFIHRCCQYGLDCLSDRARARDAIVYACAVGGLTALAPGAIAAQPNSDRVAAFLQQHL